MKPIEISPLMLLFIILVVFIAGIGLGHAIWV